MVELIKKISTHPITGQKRGIRLKQIAYIDFDLQEARIIWEEMVLDAGDAPIKSNLVATRTMSSVLSNRNKVTAQGITITKEWVESNNPIGVDETDADYSTRIDSILETELANGNLEFDFYVNAILNITKIGQAVTLLDSLNRFDRP